MIMAFVSQQVLLSKRSVHKLHPASRWCCCLNYLLVLLIFLVSSASSSEAQAERCVSQPTDGTCSQNQFYNSTNSCCMQCRDCSAVNEVVLYQCNATHDTKCIPSCSNPELQRWSVYDNKCIITDCTKCEGGDCLDGVETCRCNRCHTGPTCTLLVQTEECRAEVNNIGDNRKSEGATLNPLTIGLIAIGVVIGIVAFSSCFLLFGVCTTKQRRMSGENQGSENSESGLVSGRGFSNSTRSSYMSGMSSGTTAYLNHQSMLELLRHTSTPVHSASSSSSIRSSPKSIRSSPRLVRTSPLAPSTPDKLRESGITVV